MEQIVVRKADGTELKLFGRDPVRTVTRAEQSRALLGEDTLALTVESVQPMDFEIGDSVLAFGSHYVLNRMPTARKAGERKFAYDLLLEGAQYSLLRVLYFNTDISGFQTGTEFSLTADLAGFVGVLMNNVSRVLPGWSLGSVPLGTPVKTLSFSAENCLAVLQKLCEEFSTEFEIIRTGNAEVLHIRKVGQILGHIFEYGRGKGLYALERQTVSDKDFITRLYAFGSEKNLKADYRNYSPRLRVNTEGSYLESPEAKAAFGLIEGTKIFDDIYPHRTGTITSVNPVPAGGSEVSFTDGDMDFDLEAVSGPPITVNRKEVKQYVYLIPGVTAKVQVQSGNLAGYQFEVSGYNHATKTFTILSFKDERGQVFPTPSGAFTLSAGDTYVLLDIIMPGSYVSAAEIELETVAQTYLDQNKAPRVQYRLALDESYLMGQSADGATTNFFALGDFVSIRDVDLFINGASRVISFKRSLLRPYQYTLEIADTYEITLIQRILADLEESRTVIRINDLRDGARARYGWRTTQELLSMVFDTDDYFDTGNIRPESIETSMIVVGAKSQQFILNVVIEPNYQGEPNVVKVNAGFLTHYTVEEIIRTWQIQIRITTLTDNAARYVYAKCNKTNYNDGDLIFSGLQIKPNDDANYYHFLVGVLHGVSSDINVRWISLTYGATAINGRFIKTGRIQSFDGKTYFDLDLNEIGGKITFVSSEGQKKEVKEVDDLAKAKKRHFHEQPVPPYDIDDLWTDNKELRRCITRKLLGQAFNPNDWVKATHYDNTVTTIDGGIITSGTIQLAGDNASILAGITGQGTAGTSVRIWAGASFENRATAPFRVLQNGEVYARRRIEIQNEANVGQAGLSGALTEADGLIRIWAGSDYAGRTMAPFRVDAAGAIVATAGRIGDWQISGSGIVNDNGSAYIIGRTGTGINRTEARIGANVFPAVFAGRGAAQFVATEISLSNSNYAALFQAANGKNNFALYAAQGTSLFGDALINGRRYFGQSVSNVYLVVDPSLYDVIELYPTGTSAGLRFQSSADALPMKNGKMVVIINANDTYNNFYVSNIIRGIPEHRINGGTVLTLIWTNSFWYIVSGWDNAWGSSGPPFSGNPGNPPGGGGNQAPVVVNPMSDREVNQAGAIVEVPATTFNDPDGESLTYNASVQGGGNLPDGITFDTNSRAYTVDNPIQDGYYYLQTVASDPSGASAVDPFTLWVNFAGTGNPPTGTTPVGYGNIYEPNVTYVPLEATERPTGGPDHTAPYARSFLDNGVSKIGINLSAGGQIDFTQWDGGKNMTNAVGYSNGKLDGGRSLVASWYHFPNGTVPTQNNPIPAGQPGTAAEGHYIENGQSTEQIDGPGENSIGNNPVEPGDEGQNPNYSEVLAFANRDGKIYKKVHGMQWDLRGVPGQQTTETWIRHDPTNPRAIRIHHRLTMQRVDPWSNHYPTPRPQELPCWYTVVDYRVGLWCYGQPYTYSQLATYAIGRPGAPEPEVISTEPAIYLQNPSNGRVLAMYSPHSGRYTTGDFNFQGYNESQPTDNESWYMCGAHMLSADKNGVYDFDTAIGEFPNIGAARAWVYDQPRWDGRIQYRFDNNVKSRHGCFLHNCYDQLEHNITNGIILRPLLDNENYGQDMNIALPERWVNGRVVKHIYIRGSFQSQSNQLWLRWTKAGSRTEYYKEFTINTSGAYETIDINLTGNPDWDGQDVTQVVIRTKNPIDTYTETWQILWISDTPL